MMNLNLTGKRAVVCGSTEGIGLATAQTLAQHGAAITLIARNEAKLKSVLQNLPHQELAHDMVIADFDQPEILKKQLTKYVDTSPGVEILVNNSGGPTAGKALDADPTQYHLAFNRHLICNQLLSQALVPMMKSASYGRVINIISTSVKSPIPGLGVSNTIRGAVANWAKTLSVELAPFGITVNNILPGATVTDRLESIIKNKAAKQGISEEASRQRMLDEIPAGRFATAQEIAAAVLFLASSSAGYINGINLPVDGGRLSCL